MEENKSAPIRLFELVRTSHGHDAWRHINPMYADTLRLAIASKMSFTEGEFSVIVNRYGGGHWLGPDCEHWYALACTQGHPTAAVSVEHWLDRRPFVLNGERVYVGRRIEWEEKRWICTSIESDFIRVKLDMWEMVDGKTVQLPATLREIPREGFEAKIAAEKAAAKAERAAEREANRPDPVDLLSLDQHLKHECGRNRYGGGRYIPTDMVEWAKTYGTDYKKAWAECNSNYWMTSWMEWIGLIQNSSKVHGSPDEVRKRYSWPKMEAQIFRFVRERRGLPLRDVKDAT